ncbi:MAG: hypothetical protein U5L96_00550 [Owenweeksia sp.]|nr:hypothetical protein [Owenweeksia sp.]
MMHKALISIACVLHVFAAMAQPSFTAKVDTNRILIGQQLQLKLHSEMPANTNFIWPALPDTLSGLEVIKAGPIDDYCQQWALDPCSKLKPHQF